MDYIITATATLNSILIKKTDFLSLALTSSSENRTIELLSVSAASKTFFITIQQPFYPNIKRLSYSNPTTNTTQTITNSLFFANIRSGIVEYKNSLVVRNEDFTLSFSTNLTNGDNIFIRIT